MDNKYYKFKVSKLSAKWAKAQGVSFNDALQNWHLEHRDMSDAVYDHHLRDPNRDVAIRGGDIEYFLIAHDEAGERFISRVVSCPIRRRGGVCRQEKLPTLQELATSLGLPSDAFEGPWEGEEEEWKY